MKELINSKLIETNELLQQEISRLQSELREVRELMEWNATQRVSELSAEILNKLDAKNKEIQREQAARKCLEDVAERAYHRLRYIKGHTVCIGVAVTHVDGNCIHCLTLGYEDTLEKALTRSREILEGKDGGE